MDFMFDLICVIVDVWYVMFFFFLVVIFYCNMGLFVFKGFIFFDIFVRGF